MVILNDERLRNLGAEIFKAVGTPSKDADWVADCLVLSNLKGIDSHGVQQIPGYVKAIKEGRLVPDAKIKLLKETAATAFFDGCGGFGYIIAREAMNVTMEKANEVGVAFSGIRNLHHIGRVGRWAEMALERDMIGVASQPGGVFIAPWGGVERKLPIAPIAMAIPTGKYPPIVIDMSMGPIAGGRLSILALRGQKLPLGWLINEEGKPTDDPNVFLKGEGAQLPLGQTGLGYKGMALSLIVDVLAGPLLGLFKSHAHPFQRRGVFFGVIDIESFTPIRQFKKGMDERISEIKSSKRAEGFEEILIPGEPEWREYKKRKKQGLFLDDPIYKRILETAKSVGVDVSKYKGKSGKLDITYPSYLLKDRY